MAAPRDLVLADLGRALRARYGQIEGEGLLRSLEPWLGTISWPFAPGSATDAPSPRAAVAAAELCVLESFPDRAIDFLVPLGRIAAAGVLAETITWESQTTTRVEVAPFTRATSDPVEFENELENVEDGFQRADDEGRIALVHALAEERAASLVRRRVRLRANTLAGGRLLLTRLNAAGSADLPFSALWVELAFLGATEQRADVSFLVSWMPASHLAKVDEAIALGAPHAWCEDVTTRWRVEAWRPGWVR